MFNANKCSGCTCIDCKSNGIRCETCMGKDENNMKTNNCDIKEEE